jgi:hypothetical protein
MNPRRDFTLIELLVVIAIIKQPGKAMRGAGLKSESR